MIHKKVLTMFNKMKKDAFTKKYDIEDLEDITVACSNEDEYGESPFVGDENIDITPVASPEPSPEVEPEAEEVASDDSF